MGCTSCKNHHHHSHLSLDIPHQYHENIPTHPQFDLPDRYYLGHNSSILNRPPHFIFKFRRQCIRLNSNISNSTIVMRRIQLVGQNGLNKNEFKLKNIQMENK